MIKVEGLNGIEVEDITDVDNRYKLFLYAHGKAQELGYDEFTTEQMQIMINAYTKMYKAVGIIEQDAKNRMLKITQAVAGDTLFISKFENTDVNVINQESEE